MKMKIGDKYGHLTAIQFDQIIKGNKYYLFRCDCGETKSLFYNHVVRGNTKTCGCRMKVVKPPKLSAEERLVKKERTALGLIHNSYEKSAKQRGHTFHLTKEETTKLFVKDCYYCGTSPSNIRKYSGIEVKYNGLDRVDNSRGYTIDNIVTCCYLCNYHKGTKSLTEFLNYIAKVYEHSYKRIKELV